MQQDLISNVVEAMEAERWSSMVDEARRIVCMITEEFGGTLNDGRGTVPCAAFYPGPNPDPWTLSIEVVDGCFIWFTLDNDGSGPGASTNYGPAFDVPDPWDNSAERKFPDIEEIRTKLHAWIERVREEDKHLNEERRRSEQALAIWNEAQPIEGTPAEAYLRQTGIPSSLSLPDTLRYHQHCWHPSGRPQPAMVALLTDDLHRVSPNLDLQPCEVPPYPMVHLTYLPEDGASANTAKAEEFFLGRPGSAVEVVKQPPKVAPPIVVAESIPSALALAAGALQLLPHPVRVWATLSPEGTAKLRLPVELDPYPFEKIRWDVQAPCWIILAADGSAEGRKATQDLADRAKFAFRVDHLAAPEGQTWNDVLVTDTPLLNEQLRKIRDHLRQIEAKKKRDLEDNTPY